MKENEERKYPRFKPYKGLSCYSGNFAFIHDKFEDFRNLRTDIRKLRAKSVMKKEERDYEKTKLNELELERMSLLIGMMRDENVEPEDVLNRAYRMGAVDAMEYAIDKALSELNASKTKHKKQK